MSALFPKLPSSPADEEKLLTSLKVTRCEYLVSYRRQRLESFRIGQTVVGSCRDSGDGDGEEEAVALARGGCTSAGTIFDSCIYVEVILEPFEQDGTVSR